MEHKEFYNKTFFKQLILSEHCCLYCHSVNGENIEFLFSGCLNVVLPPTFTLAKQAMFRDHTRNQKPPPPPPSTHTHTHTHTLKIRVAEENCSQVNPDRKKYFCTLFWTGLYEDPQLRVVSSNIFMAHLEY
jgi:hypothetical protein